MFKNSTETPVDASSVVAAPSRDASSIRAAISKIEQDLKAAAAALIPSADKDVALSNEVVVAEQVQSFNAASVVEVEEAFIEAVSQASLEADLDSAEDSPVLVEPLISETVAQGADVVAPVVVSETDSLQLIVQEVLGNGLSKTEAITAAENAATENVNPVQDAPAKVKLSLVADNATERQALLESAEEVLTEVETMLNLQMLHIAKEQGIESIIGFEDIADKEVAYLIKQSRTITHWDAQAHAEFLHERYMQLYFWEMLCEQEGIVPSEEARENAQVMRDNAVLEARLYRTAQRPVFMQEPAIKAERVRKELLRYSVSELSVDSLRYNARVAIMALGGKAKDIASYQGQQWLDANLSSLIENRKQMDRDLQQAVLSSSLIEYVMILRSRVQALQEDSAASKSEATSDGFDKDQLIENLHHLRVSAQKLRTDISTNAA